MDLDLKQSLDWKRVLGYGTKAVNFQNDNNYCQSNFIPISIKKAKNEH